MRRLVIRRGPGGLFLAWDLAHRRAKQRQQLARRGQVAPVHGGAQGALDAVIARDIQRVDLVHARGGLRGAAWLKRQALKPLGSPGQQRRRRRLATGEPERRLLIAERDLRQGAKRQRVIGPGLLHDLEQRGDERLVLLLTLGQRA